MFWASIWSLPLLMVGGLVCKKGVWDGVFDRTISHQEQEEYEIGQDEDRIDVPTLPAVPAAGHLETP